jgi:hypothetical protein
MNSHSRSDQNAGHRTTDVELGSPMTIGAVAQLIGISVWGVRHTLLRQGLPHFRSGPNGKLIFYSAQVVRWIHARQKGGPMVGLLRGRPPAASSFHRNIEPPPSGKDPG